MTPGELQAFAIKLERLRALMRERRCAGAVLSRRDTLAWLTTGGDSAVVRTLESGAGTLAVTADRVFLVAYTMDVGWLADDVLAGAGVEPVPVRWHEGPREARALALCGRGPVLSDVPLEGATCERHALTRLHYPLLPLEVERCRDLGRRAEGVLRRVADALTPEKTELEVARELAVEYAREDIAVEVMLVGGEGRIPRYRHPNPSSNRLGRAALLAPAVSWRGLHANVSRTVSFGRPPPALVRAYDAVSELQALTLSLCTPGTPFRAIFDARRARYERLGFRDEWEYHFLGGPTGYVLEEDISGGLDETVQDRQAYDWFVTVTGAKVEELGYAEGGRAELLSATGRWPTHTLTEGGFAIASPRILER